MCCALPTPFPRTAGVTATAISGNSTPAVADQERGVVMKRPNRPDADAHRVRGDYRYVAAARQQTLHLFVVCIRKRRNPR